MYIFIYFTHIIYIFIYIDKFIYIYLLPSGAWKGSTHGAQVSLMFWIDTFGLILLGIQLVKKNCQIYQVDLVDIISTRTEKVGF